MRKGEQCSIKIGQVDVAGVAGWWLDRVLAMEAPRRAHHYHTHRQPPKRPERGKQNCTTKQQLAWVQAWVRLASKSSQMGKSVALALTGKSPPKNSSTASVT